MGCWQCGQKREHFRVKLDKAIAEAKREANDTGTTQAVYKEASIYKFCNIETAKINGYKVLHILSKHK